ncbi:MAG: hypothetical protein AAF078_02075 [Planctomycetota bacterium]
MAEDGPDVGDEALLRRLMAFELDDPAAAFPFSRRLSRDCGWPIEYALRAIVEYKRFVYLACVAGHSVTPSDQVDHVWHLHLVYTRSYWEQMCGEVLGRPLHHGPTKGGKAEGEKFDDWYERTLDSYRRLIGSEPPRDIWPAAAERFDRATFGRWVRRCDAWVVRKPWARWWWAGR